METRLEQSTLKMLKAEKSFMNTATLIASVVDEFADDYKLDYDKEKSPGAAGDPHLQIGNGDSVCEKDDNGNPPKVPEEEENRVIFKNDILRSSSISGFRTKMSQVLKCQFCFLLHL